MDKKQVKAKAGASGFKALVFCGFILAGVLTMFLAMSLRMGDALRAALHAGLLWVTITLIERNLDNLATAEGRASETSPPARTTRNQPGARS
jgi:hypothetical protein